jgi:hypothetical protein
LVLTHPGALAVRGSPDRPATSGWRVPYDSGVTCGSSISRGAEFPAS